MLCFFTRKTAGAEPPDEMRNDMHTDLARSTCWSQDIKNTSASEHFWNLRCSNKCAPLWGAAHFEVKMCKAHHLSTLFTFLLSSHLYFLHFSTLFTSLLSWLLYSLHTSILFTSLPSSHLYSLHFSNLFKFLLFSLLHSHHVPMLFTSLLSSLSASLLLSTSLLSSHTSTLLTSVFSSLL